MHFHCMAYLLYQSTFDCIFIKFALCLRYEHTKPAKQDEVPSSKPPVPLTAAPLAGTPDPVCDGPGGTTDAQEKPQGLGAVGWVNAAEFVPGQPYCGRGECSRETWSIVTAKTICENTVISQAFNMKDLLQLGFYFISICLINALVCHNNALTVVVVTVFMACFFIGVYKNQRNWFSLPGK